MYSKARCVPRALSCHLRAVATIFDASGYSFRSGTRGSKPEDPANEDRMAASAAKSPSTSCAAEAWSSRRLKLLTALYVIARHRALYSCGSNVGIRCCLRHNYAGRTMRLHLLLEVVQVGAEHGRLTRRKAGEDVGVKRPQKQRLRNREQCVLDRASALLAVAKEHTQESGDVGIDVLLPQRSQVGSPHDCVSDTEL